MDLATLARRHLRDPEVSHGAAIRGADAEEIAAWLGAGLDEGEHLVAVAWHVPNGHFATSVARAAGHGPQAAWVTDRRVAWIDGARGVSLGWEHLRGAAASPAGGLVVRATDRSEVVSTPLATEWASFLTAVVQTPPTLPASSETSPSARVAAVRALIDASPDREWLEPGLVLAERAAAGGRRWRGGYWLTSLDEATLVAAAAEAFGPELVAEDPATGQRVFRRRALTGAVNTRLLVRSGDHVEYLLDVPDQPGRRPDPSQLAALHHHLLELELRILAARAVFGAERSAVQALAADAAELASRAGRDTTALQGPARAELSPRPPPRPPSPLNAAVAIGVASQVTSGVLGTAASTLTWFTVLVGSLVLSGLETEARSPVQVSPALFLAALVFLCVCWVPGVLRALLGVGAMVLPSAAPELLRSAGWLGVFGLLVGDWPGVLGAFPAWWASSRAREGARPPPHAVSAAAALHFVTAVIGVVAAPAAWVAVMAGAMPVSQQLQRKEPELYAAVNVVVVVALLATTVAWIPSLVRAGLALVPLVAPRRRGVLRLAGVVGVVGVLALDVPGLLASVIAAALLLTPSARQWDPDAP